MNKVVPDLSLIHLPSTHLLWIVILFACWVFTRWRNRRSSIETENGVTVPNKHIEPPTASFPSVEPLPDFNWETTEPLQLRPFKPRYHLTMSITNSSVSELIEMDNTYVGRLTLRRHIMDERTEHVLAANEQVKSAVDEFYRWMVGTYLPTRFPRMFKVLGGGDIYNAVTNEHIATNPYTNAVDSLRQLGAAVDEDFLFLLPSSDGDGYTLEGFVACFPNGFDWHQKLGLKLRDIHGPVPGYKEKIEKSMDRFFDRLEVGKYVKRANWAISTTGELFAASGSHFYGGETLTDNEIDISKTYMRCERQKLHRLPATRAIIFSFKTYMYPLAMLKAEGCGEMLAEAIDGLQVGNVPGSYFYKAAPAWGDSVKAFLRS